MQTFMSYHVHKLSVPYLAMVKNLVLRPWPLNSLGFERLSRNMFTHKYIELSAAIHELSCAQRKYWDKNNTQLLPHTITNKLKMCTGILLIPQLHVQIAATYWTLHITGVKGSKWLSYKPCVTNSQITVTFSQKSNQRNTTYKNKQWFS